MFPLQFQKMELTLKGEVPFLLSSWRSSINTKLNFLVETSLHTISSRDQAQKAFVDCTYGQGTIVSVTKFHENIPLWSLTTASLLLIVMLEIRQIAEAAHGTRAVDHVAVSSVR